MTEALNDEKCVLEGCYTVDFLPITCNLCSKSFCTAHSSTDSHQCPASLSHSEVTVNPVVNKRVPCSFPECNAPTLFFDDNNTSASHCPHCERVFCLSHRHATKHNCPKIDAPSSSSVSKSQTLAQKAIENAKQSSSSAQSKTRTLTPKMKTVELMKMRRKADAANPRDIAADIPMDQRFFALVSYGSTEKTLWVQNNVVAGKALDLFASKLGASNSPLALKSTGGEVLQLNLLLSEQVESPANLVIERSTQ